MDDDELYEKQIQKNMAYLRRVLRVAAKRRVKRRAMTATEAIAGAKTLGQDISAQNSKGVNDA